MVENKVKVKYFTHGLFSIVLSSLLSVNLPGSAVAQENRQQEVLTDLVGIEQFQRVFQSDSGNVRLMALLSPT